MNINAISKDCAVGTSAIFEAYQFVNGAWQKLDTENNNRQLAIGEDKSIWKLDLDGKLYRWTNGVWDLQENQPAIAKNIDVQDSSRMVLSDYTNGCWFYNGVWSNLNKTLCKQTTVDKKYVYALDSEGSIWRMAI